MKVRRRFLAAVLVTALILTAALTACDDGSNSNSKSTSSNTDNKSDSSSSNDANTAKNDANEPAKSGNANDGAASAADGQIGEFHQSAALDGKNLPDVKDRLPADYKITNEMDENQLKYEIGSYGGTLRTVTSVANWDADVFVMDNEPLLNTPSILGEKITGNVLKDYLLSDDQMSISFQMRKGLKWSDGEPVTTEDIRFTVEDVLMNPELTPIFPLYLRSGGVAEGAPMKLEVLDDYNFKLTFDRPYGGLLIRLAIQGWRGYTELLKPAHYLKQFHTKYTPLATIEPAIKEAGFKPGEWVNLFNFKDITNWKLNHSEAVGFPVLYPWVITKATQSMTTYERNPYYFKVDTAGNQLPYIDKIESTLVNDIEMVSLKTIAGEVDFSRESAALVKMPLYKENEKNGYKAVLNNMHVTPTDIFLNLTYDNPTWQKVVQDVRFRKALNMAIDRQELIDTIYYGFAQPGSIEDPTFDLDQANQLLDDMGMKKNADGKRLGPDGKVFTIPFEVGAQAPDIVPYTQLISEMWRALGLNVTMKTIDQTLWGQRQTANDLQATVIWTHTPLWYMGDWGQGQWAPVWDQWHSSSGKNGKEPPEDVKKLYAKIDEAMASKPDDAKRLIEEVKQMMKDNVYYMIPLSEVKQPLIVNDKLGNIPTDSSFAIGTDFSGEQFFFKK
ncbi:ABC transporter substrate-binding protein [Paenibacillus sacheonensis]|uniref:ABC transporter substrate-binding protein n=1 Tax=Paenibacillus sacheonensis TaxID=742054 RepID=A0A7X4YLM5_9BACL|nr:ABC transporter substrate-binding protein [Paenibacillus sacheonensis]MBM7566058.1 peptide/nickel transport system substrate-binding protein [Paenibacillus sacheonensis]NBC68633.1 ABC transporter substrate-binding protein [Paenibacillus sacheonensis]